MKRLPKNAIIMRKKTIARDMPEKLFSLAGTAWQELMIEKIKAEFEKTQGADMTKMAQLLAKASGQKWKDIIEKKRAKEEFSEQLHELLTNKK